MFALTSKAIIKSIDYQSLSAVFTCACTNMLGVVYWCARSDAEPASARQGEKIGKWTKEER